MWISIHQEAFQTLQRALSTAPVLAIPNFSKPFAIETDTCHTGVGAVLLQSGHPLAFISKPLGLKTRGLSTYEKEYLAIIIAVDTWRSYLQLAEFIIFTDQKILIHLNEQRLNTVWQQKVFTKLLGLQYRVVYKKGVDNSVADALPRRSHATELISSISVVTPQRSADIIAGYKDDQYTSDMLAKLATDSTSVPHVSIHDVLLKYKDRIWIGTDATLQHQLIKMYSSPMGGHSSIPATVKRVQSLFA